MNATIALKRADDRRLRSLLRDQDDYWMRKGLQLATLVIVALLCAYVVWSL
jgi:hypothetical protein